MKILILDDERSRHREFARRYQFHECMHVSTIAQFEDALVKSGPFDLIHLDHDLADYERGMYGIEYERTGAEAAKLIVASGHQPAIVIHSWNPDGAKRMREILIDAGILPLMQPFEYVGGFRKEEHGDDGEE